MWDLFRKGAKKSTRSLYTLYTVLPAWISLVSHHCARSADTSPDAEAFILDEETDDETEETDGESLQATAAGMK